MKIADPTELNAVQWFENGDHPEDSCRTIYSSGMYPDLPHYLPEGTPFLSEGKVVRRYRDPYIPGTNVCGHCENTLHYHGWIDESAGGRTVCPGDYVVELGGEHFPMKPELYEALIAERV